MNTDIDDPFVDPLALVEANRRCDEELRRMGIDPKLPSGIRSAWKPQQLIRRGPLTDRKLAKYEKLGWFSPEFKKARKEAMDKKSFKKEMNRACGPFFEREGRLIYSP